MVSMVWQGVVWYGQVEHTGSGTCGCCLFSIHCKIIQLLHLLKKFGTKTYDSCITVDYVEDRDDDVLLLNRVKNESTVFEGHLLKEKTGVTVTIKNVTDPDDIHV